jgi:hypothetical protein
MHAAHILWTELSPSDVLMPHFSTIGKGLCRILKLDFRERPF